jgi:hypothetical protein
LAASIGEDPESGFKYGSLLELAEKVGVEYETLQKYQTVASRYELRNRFHTLTFKHHQIAAPLEDRLEWWTILKTLAIQNLVIVKFQRGRRPFPY